MRSDILNRLSVAHECDRRTNGQIDSDRQTEPPRYKGNSVLQESIESVTNRLIITIVYALCNYRDLDLVFFLVFCIAFFVSLYGE